MLLLVLLHLGGCAGQNAPRDDSAVVPPPSWQTAPGTTAALDAAALSEWWQAFEDPGLHELIRVALADSPDLHGSLAKIAEARARRGAAQAVLGPALNATAASDDQRQRQRDAGVITTTTSASAALEASWEPDLFGRQGLEVAAAEAELSAARYTYAAARVALAAEVATLYISLREAETRLSLVEQTLASREQTLRLECWREQAGQGSALTTQQSTAVLEQLRATLPGIRQTIDQARHGLTLLSGHTPGALNAVLVPQRPLPAAPSLPAAGIPAEVLRQRPDVRAAEQAVAAAQAHSGAAARERLPSLSLSGSLGIEALRAGRLFDPLATTSAMVGSLTAPIFDSGRITQNIAVFDALEQQALASYRATVLKALTEVDKALVARQQGSQRLQLLEPALEAARTAEQLARLRHTAGTVDLLVLLEAQRTLLQVEQEQLEARADLLRHHIQLCTTLGGGWSHPSP
ncbi:MAG: hypothetical protein BWK76_17560 [Desulfobulbaceae bacterium A2]|nr:MAG: hypothetical protein BWK76_17560 [Desulfobulbaceae bacterium A2]